MKHSTFEELFAQAIGTEVLKYLSHEDAWKALIQGVESTALQVLAKIQDIGCKEEQGAGWPPVLFGDKVRLSLYGSTSLSALG